MPHGELLRLEGLKKHFPASGGGHWKQAPGWVRAVDGVSLSINEGETFALVGESGCGKSTTAKLILRLEEPTEGHVYLDGKDVHALRGAELQRYRMRVQAVFQDPWGSLNPRMRVIKTVAEPLVCNQKVSAREVRERVEALLEQVGLQRSHADLFPHEFSGGQRQRIALASALIAEPVLIVLDEPVSSLDVSVQAQVMNLLKRIQQARGVSYLLVAHNLATVRYLAHHVGVMYLGELVEEAAVEDLFLDPKHPYTRALLASALPTHPDARREDDVLEGEVPSPLNPPSGCRFRTRCPFVMDVCAAESPAPRTVGDGHTVRCHLY